MICRLMAEAEMLSLSEARRMDPASATATRYRRIDACIATCPGCQRVGGAGPRAAFRRARPVSAVPSGKRFLKLRWRSATGTAQALRGPVGMGFMSSQHKTSQPQEIAASQEVIFGDYVGKCRTLLRHLLTSSALSCNFPISQEDTDIALHPPAEAAPPS